MMFSYNLRLLRKYIKGYDTEGTDNLRQMGDVIYNIPMNNALAWKVRRGEDNKEYVMVRRSIYSNSVEGRENVIVASPEEAKAASNALIASETRNTAKLYATWWHNQGGDKPVQGEDGVVVTVPRRMRNRQRDWFVLNLATLNTVPYTNIEQVDDYKYKIT